MVYQQDYVNEYDAGWEDGQEGDMPDVCCNLIRHEAVKHIIIPPKYAQLLEFVSSILVEWLRGYYALLAMKPN